MNAAILMLLAAMVSSPSGKGPPATITVRSLGCATACRWEQGECRTEEICCDRERYNCLLPEVKACPLGVRMMEESPERWGLQPLRPALGRTCRGGMSVKKVWVQKNVWIDFEAEGRHGYRGVHWRIQLFGPYEGMREVVKASVLEPDKRRCERAAVLKRSGRTGTPSGPCCRPAMFESVALKKAFPLDKVEVRLDGRFDLLDTSRMEWKTRMAPAPMTDLASRCWEKEDLSQVSVGTPEFVEVEGWSVIPDIRPARTPREAYPGHARDCARAEDGAVPHYLEVRFQFRGGVEGEARVPFCVVEFKPRRGGSGRGIS